MINRIMSRYESKLIHFYDLKQDTHLITVYYISILAII